MKLIIITAILTGLAIGAGHYVDRIPSHLTNKAVGLPDELPKMPAPVPPERQKVLDDFDDPNNQFMPLPNDPRKLVPVDPERRRAYEMAEMCPVVSQYAYRAAWIIPVIGLVLFGLKRMARRCLRAAETVHGAEIDPSTVAHEEDIGTADAGVIEQMAAEIEAYLSTPMMNADSEEENEERRALSELLEELKEKKARA